MNVIETKNLKKYYKNGDDEIKAVDGISLQVTQGEFVCVVGKSGSGKSTLLHMIGGLENPTSGEILIAGKNFFTLSKEMMTIHRRKNIGFVFQNYNLLPLLNVYENIVLPIELDGKKPDKNYIDNVIEALGISDKKNAMPGQLSGGQQQRVSIARALAIRPVIVLADEPTGNLDSKSSHDVFSLFREMNQQFSQTIMMITHDNELARMADRMICIEDGGVKKHFD